MPSDGAVLRLVGSLYEAALYPRLWPQFLQSLATSLHANSAVLITLDSESDDVSLLSSNGTRTDLLEAYQEHYWKTDLWNQRLDKLSSDSPVASQTLIPAVELIGSEFYKRFLRPQKIHHAACVLIMKQGPLRAILRVHRPMGSKAFAKGELAFLTSLLPHLKRSIEINQQFINLKVNCQAGTDALDWLPIGVILVDARGKVLAINRSAQEIVDLDDGLLISHKTISVTSAHQTTTLHRLIGDAAGNGDGQSTQASGAMIITRPSMMRPFSILVNALAVNGMKLALKGGQTPAAVIFLSDCERQPNICANTLIRLFSFTRAESRLVLALLNGRRLEEAADDFHVSMNTVRTQLKQVFLKTDTNRQAELVKLVLSSPAYIKSKTDPESEELR